MRYWRSTIPGAGSDEARGLEPDSAIRLVDTLGSARFATALLEALERRVPLEYVTAYRRTTAAPVAMRFSAGRRPDRVSARCWALYRAGPYLRDGCFDEAASRVGPDGIGWCHLVADEIDDPRHRIGVYRRHGLIDRLSIVEARPAGGWFALNLFRVEGQRHFDDGDFARLEDAAPLLFACARRHESMIPDAEAPADRLASIERRLGAHDAGLSVREVAVCSRLALGMTYDGIAADLGIAATSAKTYRNRAFARLGIRYRTELAPLAFGG